MSFLTCIFLTNTWPALLLFSRWLVIRNSNSLNISGHDDDDKNIDDEDGRGDGENDADIHDYNIDNNNDDDDDGDENDDDETRARVVEPHRDHDVELDCLSWSSHHTTPPSLQKLSS